MKKVEIIAKLLSENMDFKKQRKQRKKELRSLMSSFTCIGAPLNDNKLQFNNEQLKWIQSRLNEIEQIEF